MLSPLRSIRRETRDETWDVLIVGGGPAGLFSALSLGAAGGLRTLLIDAGPDTRDRRPPATGDFKGRGERVEYESGIGGAGLFSDGKLCLSLDVGGHLESSLDADERRVLEDDIESVFLSLVDLDTANGPDAAALRRVGEMAAAAGLGYRHNPVAHIGTDRCREVIEALRLAIELGGTMVRPDTQLLDIRVEKRSGDKIATVRAGGETNEIRARHVILALGKVGAAQEAEICARLGVPLMTQPIYVGVRLEAAADAVAPLFTAGKDPKYNLTFAGGDKIKTHCASRNGEVLTLRYSGLPLAGGHNYSGPRTARSGFSILWDGADTGADSYDAALELMRRVGSITGNRLLAQRVIDYAAGRPSRPAEVTSLPLSCADAVAGDVRAVLPAAYFERLDEFLGRLETLAPGLADERAVMYAPAIEWWMKRIEVRGRHMQTVVPGLSVCGDGSGWSQGIVHAAATGLLAAEGIHGQRLRVAGWLGEVLTEPVASARAG